MPFAITVYESILPQGQYMFHLNNNNSLIEW